MKKKVNLLLIFLMLLALPVVADAATIKYEDLPNGSYIIGTHIFTREGSGALTVKEIMLAAKTIDSDNLDDMKIIYKTMNGEYVDESTATSEKVTVDANDEITYEI